MKQCTTTEQTAKLIKLGFEKPKSEVRSEGGIFTSNARKAYSIGELIEMLPKEITNVGLTDSLSIFTDHNKMWTVEYSNVLGELLSTYRTELIDALYDMIIKLKEEGVR
ncbi:MAG: hypothetical protein J6V21_08665 [Alistipes sp.]|nr:hypothetical protein [Alistipes sp.]